MDSLVVLAAALVAGIAALLVLHLHRLTIRLMRHLHDIELALYRLGDSVCSELRQVTRSLKYRPAADEVVADLEAHPQRPMPTATSVSDPAGDHVGRSASQEHVDASVDAARAWKYGEDSVRDLFQQWCRTGEKPAAAGAIEIASMWYTGSRRESELHAPVHTLADAQGVADFVRFSLPDGTDGYLFPHPSARFNPSAHERLFQNVGENAWRNRQSLAAVLPVAIRRTAAGKWETWQV